MKKILKILKFLCSSLFIGLPAFICVIIAKIFVHDLWLVIESGDTARDNGFCFFKYLKQNHPKQKVVYVINKKSADYQKVKGIGKVCGYQTFGHWFYYFLASKEITTNPHCKPTLFLHKNLWLNKTYFLQHGIIRDYLSVYSSKKIKLKLFVTTAIPEHNFILKNFGFSDNVVKQTGLARYDNLLNCSINHNQILIMPTWREYLRYVKEEDFIKSDYYKTWKELLESELLNKVLIKYNKKIVFYLHSALQEFTHLFNSSENVIIAKHSDYDIQTLLKESALLVTDYSSVFFDFAYMQKPVLWYLFDKETYFKNHHKKGYFIEEESTLGEISKTSEELMNKIATYCENDFKLSNDRIEKIKSFYMYHDDKNCERIYNEIKGIKNVKKN